MIQHESKLNVIDNSGIIVVKCIKSLGGFYKKQSTLKNFLVVSVRKSADKTKLKKKVYLALLVGTKKMYSRKDGSYINFKKNNVIILQDKEKILGNRIFGPIPTEIRQLKLNKLISTIKLFI